MRDGYNLLTVVFCCGKIGLERNHTPHLKEKASDSISTSQGMAKTLLY